MMTRTLLARCAPLAIAASVALPAIPVAAQDAATADPVIVLPEPAPVAQPAHVPAPVIVLPETVAQPAPVARAQAEPVVAPRQAAAPRTSTRTAAPTAVLAPVAASVADPEPVSAPAAIAPAPVTPTAPVAQAPSADPLAAPAAAHDGTGEMALAVLLGSLGLAAVGGIAFLASRRRPLEREAAAYELTPAMEPTRMRVSEPAAAPVLTSPATASAMFAAPVVNAAPAPRAIAHASGDPVALPNSVPETFEERDALLRELVAAEPDRANPFTSPRARARRAKLIIQSLARDFTSRKPRFDLSEYTNRWPALRGWQPATA
ncbi:MAG: hypothetical protein JNJ92_06225 [Altererythrobacter sp.]|nr:hypothetical protein [Altererythrobacter sp.]